MTKELADSLFYYKDGNLYWKENRGTYPCKDNVVGAKTKAGYLESKICGKPFKAHRVVFLMHYGYTPKCVDHINGNRADNRIENLRDADSLQNKYNQKIYKNNTSGAKGVYWIEVMNKWKAQINYERKRKHLGYFNSFDEAEEFVDLARKMTHKQFARAE